MIPNMVIDLVREVTLMKTLIIYLYMLISRYY